MRPQVVASGLQNPWAVAFLPQGRFLVSERPGRMRVIEEFPFFQTVRLLYTKKLHAIGDTRYMNELGKAAIFCADRSKLFYLIHAERYNRLLNLPGCGRRASWQMIRALAQAPAKASV